MNKEKLTGQATDEQIEAWKKEHGDIFKLAAGNSVCYLKKPTRKILGYAGTGGKNSPLKFNEILLEHCWLGGDEKIKTDDTLFLSASGKLSGIVKTVEASLEKL